jgi:hypothetical protein
MTHPFVSLRTFFVSIEISLDLEDYSFTPEMAELLDLYLEPFQRFAPREELLNAYQLSKPVASIVRRSPAPGITRMGTTPPEYAWIVPG